MKSIIILSLLALTLCKGFGMMGSWQKDTFASNDIRIDRARQAAEAKYLQIANVKEDDVELIPLAVYRQLVNGLNYKIIFATICINFYSVFVECFFDVFGQVEIYVPVIGIFAPEFSADFKRTFAVFRKSYRACGVG